MLKHHKRTTGYSFLFLGLFFSLAVLTLLLAGLASAIGLKTAWPLAGGIIFAAFWGVGFVVMQRFINIENRRPTLYESNKIGANCILYVLGFCACVAVLVLLGGALASVFGGGGGSGGPPGAGGAGQSGPSAEQSEQAMRAIFGVLTFLLLLYLAPFLNLALFSRAVAPKVETR